MSASMIELNHTLPNEAFYCPLTGAKVFDDIDQTFEECTSPYFVFVLTDDGMLFSRSGLPETHLAAMQDVTNDLLRLDTTDMLLSALEMPTYVPNVMAGMLPESVVIFELRSRGYKYGDPCSFVAMDFSLEPGRIDPSTITDLCRLVEVV
ncbi:MAG: hypothetical protein ACNA7J_06290 [Wenzhouxiangella sp.]